MIAEGVPPAVFWNQTPRETQQHLRFLEGERRRQAQSSLVVAWNTAALMRCEPLPDLRELLRGDEEQSDEEQLAACRAIALSFGGNVDG